MNPKEGIRTRNVRKVTGYLLNALLQLPYGGRLPEIRTIMERTGTGQITVSHVPDVPRYLSASNREKHFQPALFNLKKSRSMILYCV